MANQEKLTELIEFMAEIKPFGALRFTEKAGGIADLCCPPYDIISEQQRLGYLAKNEHNIIRLELPREGENPYACAADVLKKWESDGIVACDEQPGVYIYEEKFSVEGVDYAVKGIICRVKIEEFSKGVVLPHEETLSKAKQDRFNLFSATMCNFSQIYSLYKDERGETSKLINKLSACAAAQSFTDGDGVTHSLWPVYDADAIAALTVQFAPRKLYIADGHHRYETSLNFRNHLRESGAAKIGDDCDYVMMMLVDLDNDGLVVFPTHRIVRDIDGFDADAVIDGCREYFDVEMLPNTAAVKPALDAKYADGKKSVVLYAPDRIAMLTLKTMQPLDELFPNASEALRGLDVTVLHSLILERILGIDKENMANQINLTYTRAQSEAIDAVNGGKANCCFIMNPTRVCEISAVATAGEKMPQKSTYFYPKLITGLVMNKFGEI